MTTSGAAGYHFNDIALYCGTAPPVRPSGAPLDAQFDCLASAPRAHCLSGHRCTAWLSVEWLETLATFPHARRRYQHTTAHLPPSRSEQPSPPSPSPPSPPAPPSPPVRGDLAHLLHPHEGRSANAGAQRLLEPLAGCSLPCSPGRRLAPRPSRRRRWLSKCGWSTGPTPPLDEWKFCTTEIVSYSLAKLCRWSRQLATFNWLQCDDPQLVLPPHLLTPSPAFPFCLCRGYHLRQ